MGEAGLALGGVGGDVVPAPESEGGAGDAVAVEDLPHPGDRVGREVGEVRPVVELESLESVLGGEGRIGLDAVEAVVGDECDSHGRLLLS